MRTMLLTVAITAAGFCSSTLASGVSPYLPLQLSPEIERQVERLLVFADMPELKRPYSAATVQKALAKGCQDAPLVCNQVRAYLSRYKEEFAITHASAELRLTKEGDATSRANERGESEGSQYDLSGQGLWQPHPNLAISLGYQYSDDGSNPEGSYISAGFDWAQIDVGYRPHWLSPAQSGAFIWSTEAETPATVTLSNSAPLWWGLRYEMFVGQLSSSNKIAYQGGYTSGKPNVVGFHLGVEPLPGLAIGFNRAMQFGGGARGGLNAKDILKAFFNPNGADNTQDGLTTDEEFGNQIASFSTKFTIPGRFPISLYAEYAGEDTSRGESWRLGNAALTGGIYLPAVTSDIDLTYEFSEWQNSWYTHHIYQDGFANDGNVIGYWGADQRINGDGVGGQAHYLAVGWQHANNRLLQVGLRYLDNESYGIGEYEPGYNLQLRYSAGLKSMLVGSEVRYGHDVFGENYASIGLFGRW